MSVDGDCLCGSDGGYFDSSDGGGVRAVKSDEEWNIDDVEGCGGMEGTIVVGGVGNGRGEKALDEFRRGGMIVAADGL